MYHTTRCHIPEESIVHSRKERAICMYSSITHRKLRRLDFN